MDGRRGRYAEVGPSNGEAGGIAAVPPFTYVHAMILALLLAAQLPGSPLFDPDLRPPCGQEVRAAEARDRRRLPLIIALCREAARAGDPEAHVRRFADRNGLSTYGRLALAANCRLYRQGVEDGVRGAARLPEDQKRKPAKPER